MQSSLTPNNQMQGFVDTFQRKSIFKELDIFKKFESPKFDSKPLSISLFSSKVPAGFPSPAEEHIEARLNPNDFLIDQEDATFFVTIQGHSMIELGLMPGDKVVVDRSKSPGVGNIVLAVIDGEFTIKILAKHKSGAPRLLPANKDFRPIEITGEMQFEIWGVVIGSFRRFR